MYIIYVYIMFNIYLHVDGKVDKKLENKIKYKNVYYIYYRIMKKSISNLNFLHPCVGISNYI